MTRLDTGEFALRELTTGEITAATMRELNMDELEAVSGGNYDTYHSICSKEYTLGELVNNFLAGAGLPPAFP